MCVASRKEGREERGKAARQSYDSNPTTPECGCTAASGVVNVRCTGWLCWQTVAAAKYTKRLRPCRRLVRGSVCLCLWSVSAASTISFCAGGLTGVRVSRLCVGPKRPDEKGCLLPTVDEGTGDWRNTRRTWKCDDALVGVVAVARHL
jgi:hypothetical protein